MTQEERFQVYALKSIGISTRGIARRLKGAIVSYVDRCSKFTLLHKIERKTAAAVVSAALLKMKDLPHPVKTITYDNDKEFSVH